MNGMLDLIVERVRSLTGADEAVVLQWNNDHLTVRAASGLDPASVAPIAAADDHFIESWVAQNNAPVFVPDLRREPSLRSAIGGQRAALDALAALPLRADGDVVGVLEVRGAAGGADFVAQAPLLIAMADIATAALPDDRPAARPSGVAAPGFVRALTHDLKSPLTAIRGHAQLMQRRAERSGAESDVKTAATIIEQVQRMTALLNTVADAGLAEEGKLVLQLTPLDAVAVVRHAVEPLQPADTGPRIVVTAPEQALQLEGDEDRLTRVVTALVGNALSRAGSGGCVEVGVTAQGSEVVVTVQNENGGTAPARLSHIFDWAHQGASESHRAFDLALYSAQRIIEAHHGRLWATSSPEGGATFAFTLPASTTAR